MTRLLPSYPVYVPSKGRWDSAFTARFLRKDGTPFHFVVEPQEEEAYREAMPWAEFLVLPHTDQGLHVTRCWIQQHAIDQGHARHWQLDDNMRVMRRWHQGYRLPVNSSLALRAVEQFVDRYENIAIAGLNYEMFCVDGSPPFLRNARVYSCSLIQHSADLWWRDRYNDDVDICLQALGRGHCTCLVNAFMVEKERTMDVPGGNTPIYQRDGRLRMARALKRRWPHLVDIKRRWNRPQHVVRDSWKKFDTPFIRRQDIDWDSIPETDEQGMVLRFQKEPKNATTRKLGQDMGARPLNGDSP